VKLNREKFAKVAGLMGSEHAGERATAAMMAEEMLRAAGMTWGGHHRRAAR
jgi:hypothetical protein